MCHGSILILAGSDSSIFGDHILLSSVHVIGLRDAYLVGTMFS